MTGKPSKLEDLIFRHKSKPKGRAFVELSVELLRAMGFTDIYVRKGSECGRDIDARLGAEKWFFECKNSEAQVDTPKAAYKLLQLDCLASDLQPDHFVIVTNGTTPSILRDIASCRNADPSCPFTTHIWSNDETRIFNDILLSYPEASEAFLSSRSHGCDESSFQNLIVEFRSRSGAHIRRHQRFLPRFLSSAGYASRRDGPETKAAKFQAEAAFRATCEALDASCLSLVLVASPPLPGAPLYNFYNHETTKSLQATMWKLDTMLTDVDRDHLIFHELLARTYLSQYGAVGILTSLLSADGVIDMPEWILPLRENCVRLRNFARLGILPVPFDVKAYLVSRNANRSHFELAGFEPLRKFGKHRAFAGTTGMGESPTIHFQSSLLRIGVMPHSHYELARPLAGSLWAKAGRGANLAEQAKSFFKGIQLNDNENFAMELQFATAVAWLFQDEVLDRSFDVFAGYLEDDKKT